MKKLCLFFLLSLGIYLYSLNASAQKAFVPDVNFRASLNPNSPAVMDASGDSVIVEEADMVKKMIIYPNPNVGLFTIKIDDSKAYVQLVNMGGEVFFSDEQATKEKKYDFSMIPKGNYFLKVCSTDDCLSKKIIIQ